MFTCHIYMYMTFDFCISRSLVVTPIEHMNMNKTIL